MRALHLCWCVSLGAGCNYRREASDRTGPVGRLHTPGGAEVEQDIQAHFSYSCQQRRNLQIFTCTVQLVRGDRASRTPAPHSSVWLGVKTTCLSDSTSSDFQVLLNWKNVWYVAVFFILTNWDQMRLSVLVI